MYENVLFNFYLSPLKILLKYVFSKKNSLNQAILSGASRPKKYFQPRFQMSF